MASVKDIFKTLGFPALVALVIYLLTIYLVLPYYRRYASYIPLHSRMQSLNTRTRGIWWTGMDAVLQWIAKSWVRIRHPTTATPAAAGGSDGSNDESEGEDDRVLGEGMVPFSIGRVERERLRRTRDNVDSGARLSRELEEGFMDDSDSDREWVSQI